MIRCYFFRVFYVSSCSKQISFPVVELVYVVGAIRATSVLAVSIGVLLVSKLQLMTDVGALKHKIW
jgi:hypothetical protein